MDQIKIGRFIAQKRKEQKMTQNQLAEKLGITDRAVSKWETGKSLPDASIMLELCDLLGITVNDLLCGEAVSMKNYNETAEKTLLEMVEQKELTDKIAVFAENSGWISDSEAYVKKLSPLEDRKNGSRAYQQNDLHGYTLSYSVLQAAAKTLRTVFLVARRQNSAVSLFEIR